MQRLNQFILVTVLVCLAIVMVQNTQIISFRFLNWTYGVAQLLLVLIVFIVGFLAGFLVAKWPRKQPDDLA
jgi:uncharacterized integral membrane protein